MVLIPHIIEMSQGRERSYDIFSRLIKDRIVMVTGEITDELAAVVNAHRLFLEAKDPDKDIFMYINSPGGSVSAGMSVYDIMQHMPCDVQTIGMGLCASMGSVLLAGGTAGKRALLAHSEVMIHQPLGRSQGQATEIEIACQHIMRTKEMINRLLAERTGKDLKTVAADTERDNWMSAEEAVAYGIADYVIAPDKGKNVPAAGIGGDRHGS